MSIIISIVTILASGVCAAMVTYQLNTTKELVLFMRRKAEELYLAFDRYNRSTEAGFVRYYNVIKNEITYNQLLDLQIEKGAQAMDIGDKLNTTEMLTRVYFPELWDHFDRYEAARTDINNILDDHKSAYKRGDTDGRRWLNPFHDAMLKFGKTATEFKRAIIEKGRELAAADAFFS